MFITQTTTVHFRMPEEAEKAKQFEKDNDFIDWKKKESAWMCEYSIFTTCMMPHVEHIKGHFNADGEWEVSE